MRLKKWPLVIAAAALLILNVIVQAQTHTAKNVFSLKLGDTVVTIPPPEGFEEVSSQFENIKARFAATEPPQSELLAAYLTTTDSTALRNGKIAAFEEYAKIAVIRMLKERPVSRAEFTATVDYIRGNAAKILDPNTPELKSVFDQFDKQLRQELSKEVKSEASSPTLLGSFDDRENVYSAMIMMTITREVEGKSTSRPVLGTLNVLYMKERLISVATYRGYHSRADVDTLKSFTTKWINSILAAN